MADTNDADKQLKENAAEFMKLLIRLVKEHQDAVTEATLVSAALLHAVAEKFPEIGESYERHLEQSKKSSPLAERSRHIHAELDRLTQQLVSSHG